MTLSQSIMHQLALLSIFHIWNFLLDSGQHTFSSVHKTTEQCKFEGLTWSAVLHERFKFSLSRSSRIRRSCRVCGKNSGRGAIQVVFQIQRVASQHPCRAMVCFQLSCLYNLKKMALKRQYAKVGQQKSSDYFKCPEFNGEIVVPQYLTQEVMLMAPIEGITFKWADPSIFVQNSVACK